MVEEIGRVDPNDGDLEPFVSNSGFDSVDEWRAAIRASNGTLPESGWLYRVKTRAATLNAVDRP